MGMGGGTGSSGTLAHVHDNNVGQGGALSALTLVGSELLNDITPYRVLADHIATGAESSFTFTPSTPLDFDDISKILVVIDGDSTGTGNLQFTVNGIVTVYMITGFTIASGVYSDLTSLNQASIVLDGLVANQEFKANFTIHKGQGGDDNEFGGEANVFLNANARTWISMNWSQGASLTTLSEIEVSMSASTWKTGTRITIYGLNR